MVAKRTSLLQADAAMGPGHGMLILGFALCQTWLTLCFFAPQLFDSAMAVNTYDLSLIVTIAVLIPGVITPKRMEKLVASKGFLMAIAICACVGTLLVPFASLTTGLGLMLFGVAGLLTGFASGWLFVGWYCVFINLHDYTGYVLSVALNAVLLYLFTNLLLPPLVSPWLLVAVAVMLPIPCIAILNHYTTAYSNKNFDVSLPRRSPQRAELMGLCFIIFVVSSICEFLRNVFLDGSDLAFYSGSTYLILLIIKVALALAFLVVMGRSERSIALGYRTAIFLIALAVVALPIMDANLGYALVNVGAFILKIMVTLVTFQLIDRFRMNMVFVFSIVRIIWAADIIFGSFLVNAYHSLLPTHPTIVDWAGAAAAVILFVIALFVLSDQRISPNVNAEQNHQTPQLEARCARIARTDGLSPRESEILVLLAHGRSTPRIQEELTLSENTVNSHIRHIFQKVGVHSRQELLDLVEKTEP